LTIFYEAGFSYLRSSNDLLRPALSCLSFSSIYSEQLPKNRARGFHPFHINDRDGRGGFYTAGKVIKKFPRLEQVYYGASVGIGAQGYHAWGCFHFKTMFASQYYTALYGLLFDTETMLEEHDLHDCLHGKISWGRLIAQNRHCN